MSRYILIMPIALLLSAMLHSDTDIPISSYLLSLKVSIHTKKTPYALLPSVKCILSRLSLFGEFLRRLEFGTNLI